ncbi:MAG TPA: hypothetical protein VE979_06075 [Streptosporangiaceae bacterium]|nr:hypothetical protein [Streptosporangiaceae bacterium]
MTFGESTRPIDWSLTVGRRRTRQAAPTDDPLRMARCLLAGKALAGIVDAVDREHREVVTTNRARRRAAGRAIARSFWGDGGTTVR